MRDLLIRWLGGYTEKQFEYACRDYESIFEEMVRRGDTIQELQALVPKPKRMGRPRKVNIAPVKVA